MDTYQEKYVPPICMGSRRGTCRGVFRKLTPIPGLSRRPCSSASRTQPSTETWVSTNCSTYGTIYYRHLLHCNSSLPAFQYPHPTHLNTPLQVPHPTTHTGRRHILFLVSIQCLGLILPQTLLKHPKSCYKLHPYSSAILVSSHYFIC